MKTDPKVLIEAEIKTVESELGSIAQPDPVRPGEWIAKREDLDTDKADELETAEDLEELEGHEAIAEKLEMRLRDLRHALKRAQDGSYGVCEVCQKPIEEGRLSANIAASTCVEHMK
jgi:RNA polymerase-binding transcription factor DksA